MCIGLISFDLDCANSASSIPFSIYVDENVVDNVDIDIDKMMKKQ